MASVQRINNSGLAIVKYFESFQALPYLCPAGYWTVGYGHVVQPGANGVTEAEAEVLLAHDLGVAERRVARLCSVPLTENMFSALCSFVFNLGGGALQRSSLRAKLNRGEYADAQEEFSRWVYAGGKRLLGLVRRRAAEALLFGE